MILVTGGTGLVGAHLLHTLATQPHSPALCATYRHTDRISQNKLLSQIPQGKIKWIQADVLDIPALTQAFVGITHVYHCAAIVGFHPSTHAAMLQTNIQGTANIVNLALAHNIQKLIHVSSIAALGSPDVPNATIDETTEWQPNQHTKKYALSKYNSEMEVWRSIEEGLNATIINPSVILGTGNYNETSTQLFKTIYQGMPACTPGTTGYVDVRDVVQCMIQLMHSNTSAQRFIVSAENISFMQLFTTIAHALNKKPPRFTPPRYAAELLWRILELQYKFTKKTPIITKETVESAYQTSLYSNEKIRTALQYNFIPINQTIEWVAQDFLKNRMD